MALAQFWMVEIVRRRAGHAEPLHDRTRAQIGWDGKGDDLVQTERAESVRNGGSGGLRRVSAAPVRKGQPPADLDARREVRLEGRRAQTREADELRHARRFYGPESEATAREVALNRDSERVAGGTVEGAGEVLHHARIGIKRREGREILVTPGAEEETGRGQANIGHG